VRSWILSRPARLAAAVALTLAVSLGGAASANEDPPDSTAERAIRLQLRAPVEARYTSNLFHIQDRRLATFDTHRDPGQRFHGMETIWDLVLRPGLRATLDVPVGRRRGLELGLGADYSLHLNNRIADYFRGTAIGSWNVTRHDTVASEMTLAPHRYRKNFRGPDGITFEPAYLRELEIVARYEREWASRIATQLEYQLGQLAYDDPFHNRNALGHEGRAAIVVGRKTRIEIGGGLAISTAPGEVEGGIVVDRSFRDAALLARGRLALSEAAAIDASAEHRTRNFTTSVAQDLTHFDRTDRRVRVELAASGKLGGGFSLRGFAGYTRNHSNRSDPNLTADEAGYVELVVGATVAWRCSTGGEQ
jgi:hypothetical protein